MTNSTNRYNVIIVDARCPDDIGTALSGYFNQVQLVRLSIGMRLDAWAGLENYQEQRVMSTNCHDINFIVFLFPFPPTLHAISRTAHLFRASVYGLVVGIHLTFTLQTQAIIPRFSNLRNAIINSIL